MKGAMTSAMTSAMIGRTIALAIALIALVSLPGWIGGIFYVNIASQILFYAILALGVNVLVGYAGLVSLGHAGLFGIAAYAAAYLLANGHGHPVAIVGALAVGLAATAVFAVLSLRATGIGFIMITLAVGEIVWGLAYRWISITNGDNGINVSSRPQPFGLSLASPVNFYYASLVVFLLALAATAVFVASPFGAALRGTRDQPRRMTALGYHVWLIRFFACMFSGLLTCVAGLLFIYYNQFISPQTLALTASAEALLMAISGGAGTLLGPAVGAAVVIVVKNVVSGVRFTDLSGPLLVVWGKSLLNGLFQHWNFLLGAIFVAIVILMPEGLVPGTVRLTRAGWRALGRRKAAAAPAAPKAMP